MVAILTEAEWPMVRHPAASVRATGVSLTRVLALIVVASLTGGAITVIATASYAQVIATQESIRTVTVIGTLSTAVAITTNFSTVALSGITASLDTEATLTRATEATVTEGDTAPHWGNTSHQRITHSVGGTSALGLVVHYLTLSTLATCHIPLAWVMALSVNTGLLWGAA